MNDRQRDIGPARQHGALDVAVIEKSRIGVNYAEHAGTCRSAQPLVKAGCPLLRPRAGKFVVRLARGVDFELLQPARLQLAGRL